MSALRMGLVAFVLFAAAANLSAQSERESVEGTGAITGRVTVNGSPASGIVIGCVYDDIKQMQATGGGSKPVIRLKAVTDKEGNYRLTGLKGGRYRVAPFVPAHTSTPGAADSAATRLLIVSDGNTVEDVNFVLKRGGVITGRVIKPDGRPLIGEAVSISRVLSKRAAQKNTDDEEADDEDDGEYVEQSAVSGINLRGGFRTDDRGIYRIYGLAAGKYLLSVGGIDQPFEINKRNPTRIFYPGVADRVRATLVEVPPGGEVTDIDIKLGFAPTTYRATGRVVDTESGKPVANAFIFSAPAERGGGGMAGLGMGGLSNDKGEFRIEGILPGRYMASAAFALQGESEYYCDPLTFEIKNGDVTGLVIKAHRGLTLTGVVVVEGATDAKGLANLSQVELVAFTSTETDSFLPSFSRSKLNPDGSFQFRGLRPGKVRFTFNSMYSVERSIQIIRVERGGVDQKGFIDVAAGEPVTDLRIFVAQANASIRGQVRIQGGPLPRGAYLGVTALRTAHSDDEGSRYADVSGDGSFEIGGLLPGEYELSLNVLFANNDPKVVAVPIPSVKQSLTVAASVETTVTMVLDLTATERKRER